MELPALLAMILRRVRRYPTASSCSQIERMYDAFNSVFLTTFNNNIFYKKALAQQFNHDHSLCFANQHNVYLSSNYERCSKLSDLKDIYALSL